MYYILYKVQQAFTYTRYERSRFFYSFRLYICVAANCSCNAC